MPPGHDEARVTSERSSYHLPMLIYGFFAGKKHQVSFSRHHEKKTALVLIFSVKLGNHHSDGHRCARCHSFNSYHPASQNLGEPKNTLTKWCSILANGKLPCLRDVMVPFLATSPSICTTSPRPHHSGLASVGAMTTRFTYPNDWVWPHMITSAFLW